MLCIYFFLRTPDRESSDDGALFGPVVRIFYPEAPMVDDAWWPLAHQQSLIFGNWSVCQFSGLSWLNYQLSLRLSIKYLLLKVLLLTAYKCGGIPRISRTCDLETIAKYAEKRLEYLSKWRLKRVLKNWKEENVCTSRWLETIRTFCHCIGFRIWPALRRWTPSCKRHIRARFAPEFSSKWNALSSDYAWLLFSLLQKLQECPFSITIQVGWSFC